MTGSSPNPDAAELAGMIDHTVLRADAGEAEIDRFCDEARAHRFRSVCVNGVHARRVAERLQGSESRCCVVVGFPLGAMHPEAKAAEAARAVADGAGEIDMVVNVGALKDGRLDAVRDDIAAVRAACSGAVLKVIIESCLLDDAQKRAVCRLAAEAGADFVKTSTGFSTGGATEADVRLMREVVGPGIGVKASGGVRTRETALAMIAAGANRIGTSSGLAIVSGVTGTSGPY